MSPNLVDLDRAVEELRTEAATPAQRERALGLLVRPPRPRWRAAGLAAASLTVAAVAFLAVPSRGSGMAWTTVVQSMQSAALFHTRTLDKSGRPIGEGWRSGPYYANVYRSENGRVLGESRRDAKTLYSYLALTPLQLPNAYYFARLMSIRSNNPYTWSGKNTVDGLLADKHTKMIRHAPAELDGKAVERYVVSFYGTETATVDADPGSGRVLRIEHPRETTYFDYPETIDPGTFSWTSRVTRDAPVLDTRGLDPKRPTPMPKPIATKNGVQLRALHIDPYGSLYATWTGERYSRLQRKPFRVLGVKTGKPWYGPGPYRDGRRTVDALTSVNLPLLEKVGDRLTIQIPTGPRSVVAFKDVAVTRLRPL